MTMIMALIRLRANIHTLQQLQSYRQSKAQIEPAAVQCQCTLTPLFIPTPKYRDMQPVSAGHMEQVLLIHTGVRGVCLCFLRPSTISSSLCFKNDWETQVQSVSTGTWSPSAIFGSPRGSSECACRA